MADSDLDVIRSGYAAFSAGDLAAVRELFAVDATWEVPGSSPLSGTKQGRDEILAYLGEVMTRSAGTFKATQLAMAEGGGRVFSLDRSEATRNGASLITTGVNVFQLQDGRVRAVQQYYEDTAEADAFWS